MLVIALLLYALRLLHLYTETLTFFDLFLILEGLLSRCRCRDALKLWPAPTLELPFKSHNVPQVYGGTADGVEDEQPGGPGLQEHGPARHVHQVDPRKM